jgi:hypothetical protein
VTTADFEVAAEHNVTCGVASGAAFVATLVARYSAARLRVDRRLV